MYTKYFFSIQVRKKNQVCFFLYLFIKRFFTIFFSHPMIPNPNVCSVIIQLRIYADNHEYRKPKVRQLLDSCIWAHNQITVFSALRFGLLEFSKRMVLLPTTYQISSYTLLLSNTINISGNSFPESNYSSQSYGKKKKKSHSFLMG